MFKKKTKKKKTNELDDEYDGPISLPKMKLNYKKIGIWLCLCFVFYYIHFLSVFIIASLLYFLYTSLTNHGNVDNKGRKLKSAYSLFNPNFEKIDGTLDADAFDREIRRKMY